MNATIELADGRRIGRGFPTFIIAEAGSNWRMGTPDRDLLMGRALIDVAAESGCDAVKFQTYRAANVYVQNAGESEYLAELGIRKSINEIFVDLEMPYGLIGKLAEHCKRHGIYFMSTPFSCEDCDAVDPFVPVHKIASYEISHTELLSHVAKTGKPILMSTGASTLEDIDFAVSHLREHGAEAIAILQCTAKYPAPLDSINLRAIATLRERYQVPTGLSDHSRDPWIAPVGAVALGACVIEKHFTLHNRLPGADHPFAITPDQLSKMVKAIRDMEAARGDGRKRVGEAEQELAAFARRGLQATRDIRAGEPLRLGDNVAILRPGTHSLGLHPRYAGDMEGKRALLDVAAGEGIVRQAFES